MTSAINLQFPAQIYKYKTRLHSSRMRTARALTVSPSMLCCGGGGCLLWGGVCSWGGLLWGGLLRWGGGCLLGGGSALGGVCCGGVSTLGVLLRGCRPPPRVNRMTHACKNITLPQLRCGR